MNKLIQNNNSQQNNDLLSFLYNFQEIKKEPLPSEITLEDPPRTYPLEPQPDIHEPEPTFDPSSYALNFDDGCCAAKKFIGDARLMELTDIHNNTLVYVLWIKTNWSSASSLNFVIFAV